MIGSDSCPCEGEGRGSGDLHQADGTLGASQESPYLLTTLPALTGGREFLENALLRSVTPSRPVRPAEEGEMGTPTYRPLWRAPGLGSTFPLWTLPLEQPRSRTFGS